MNAMSQVGLELTSLEIWSQEGYIVKYGQKQKNLILIFIKLNV